MLGDEILDLRLLKSWFDIIKLGHSWEELIKSLCEGRFCWDWNRWKAVLEMREDIGSCFRVNYLYEESGGLDAVIETVQVYEMNRFSLIIFQFGDPKNT